MHPWIDLHLDGMRHMSDLHRGEADAAIRVGDGEWPELQVDCLGEEYLTPVCSPKVLQTTGPFKEPNELSRVTLLHFSEQPQWRRWLTAAGADQVDASNGVKFSETVMALEAAQASQGFACARLSLVAEELASGVLVRPFDLTIPDNQRYYFCVTERAATRNHVAAFRSWLLDLNGRLRKQRPSS
jgi:LysR family glycine cleavage system transcriptional activator